METKRVYTKSTPLLVELHKKHGTMGSNIEGCYFDNTDGYDNTGQFASSSCFKNYYIDRGYTELTEQEFIEFMAFNLDTESNPIEPSHYTKFAIQPIDYIEANKLDFFEGNVVKYVSRYKSKNGLEDLKKAQFYLNRLIEIFASSESK